MRLSRLLTVSAVLYLVVGGAFALWPYDTMGLFGVDPMSPLLGLDPDWQRRLPVWTLFGFTRLFGTTLLGAGVIAVVLRRTASPDAQRDVATALFLFNLLAGAMMGLQQLAIFSLYGELGWWLAAAFAFLVAGFGYLLFSARGVAPVAGDLRPGRTLGEVRAGWERDVREAAAQQERSRLARDLHDSIKQQLFTINVSAAATEARLATDPAGARSALAEVREAAREAMAEMEAMLQHLQPVPLATIGLVEALRKQCEAIRYRTGAEVTLDVGELPGPAALPPAAQAALFRIAQEALSNIARHARARHVAVRLAPGAPDGPWSVELEVRDDGSGFDPAAVASGMGLANLRARAGELGAELQVDSGPGRGTRVVVRVPFGVAAASTASARLQRSLLLGLAVVFHAGLIGRPVLGGWVFWSLLPFAAAAAWLSLTGFRSVAREQRELARRLGAGATGVLRLRRERAQAVVLLVVAACAWNALVAITPLSYLGLVQNGAPVPAAFVALLGIATAVTLAATLPLHRALAAQKRTLSAAEFRRELRRAIDEAAMPLVLLLASIGIFGRFLREPMIVLLPTGLALWVASLAIWALRSRTADASRPATART